jgi:hypothetical protein
VGAYLICYVERSPPGADQARARMAQRIAERWDNQVNLDGTWIIEAEATSDDIRDALTPCVRPGDGLIVVGAGRDAAWHGFAPSDAEWLIEHI